MINYQILQFFFIDQQTPLHVATRNGRDYTVKCLVEKGADINIKDKTGVGVTILTLDE